MNIPDNSIITLPSGNQCRNEPNKIIEESFFLKNVVTTGNNETFQQTHALDLHKWIHLRNTIQKDDFILMNLSLIPNNQPGRAVQQLNNYLKILRLQPAKDAPTVHVEISNFITKKTQSSLKKNFSQLILLKGAKTRAILPCSCLVIPKEVNQETPDIQNDTKKLLNDCPTVIHGMILGNLKFDEFYTNHAQYAYEPMLAVQLKREYTQRAWGIAQTAQQRHNGDGPILSIDELRDMAPISPYVREWKLTGSLTQQRISVLATAFPNIEKLDMSGCQNVDLVLSELQNFKKLHALKLQGTDVTGATFMHLPPSLRTLNCRLCPNLRDGALCELKDFSLTKLDISGTSLRGTYLDKLGDSLKILQCISCKNLPDEALLQLAQCTSLEELDISGTLLRGTYFAALPRSLKKLNFEECHFLESDALSGLEKCALEELNISISFINLGQLWFGNVTLELFPQQINEYSNYIRTLGFIKVTRLPRTLKRFSAKNNFRIDDKTLLELKGRHLDELNFTDFFRFKNDPKNLIRLIFQSFLEPQRDLLETP
jgi:hypothetical protein